MCHQKSNFFFFVRIFNVLAEMSILYYFLFISNPSRMCRKKISVPSVDFDWTKFPDLIVLYPNTLAKLLGMVVVLNYIPFTDIETARW